LWLSRPALELPVIQKVKDEEPSFFSIPQSACVLFNLTGHCHCLGENLIEMTELLESIEFTNFIDCLVHHEKLINDALLFDLLHCFNIDFDCLAAVTESLGQKCLAHIVPHKAASLQALLEGNEVVDHPALNNFRLEFA
jgi:hypothetical protein